MRDEEDAETARRQVAEDVEDVDAGRSVEHADDLVGHQQLELEHQCARDQQALQLAAAQLVRVLAEHGGGLQADRLEGGSEPVAPLVVAEARQEGAADQVEHPVGLEDRVVRAERILEDALDARVVPAQAAAVEPGHVLAPEADRAVGHVRQPEDEAADRRLAAAALADQRDDLSRLNLERDVGDGGDALAAERAGLELLRDAFEAEHQAATFQHAAWRPGSNSTNGGCSAHFANASGQRCPESAPRRRLEQRRRPARDAAESGLVEACARLGQRAEEHARVRMPRVVDDRGGGALLDEPACVHDDDRVRDLVEDRQVVGDHDRALHEPAVPELDEQLRDGLLGGDVERGRQLVGDQERRIEECREHHHDALLHPAGELDREAVENVGREPDQRQPALQLGQLLVVGDAAGPEEIGGEPADLPGRVESALRVLRDQRDLAEAEAVHRRVVRDRQLGPVERDGAVDVAHPPVEADEALRERRLPAARLARQAGDLAVADREGDTVDRSHVAVERPVADLQVLDREAHVRRSLGLKISSRPTFVT